MWGRRRGLEMWGQGYGGFYFKNIFKKNQNASLKIKRILLINWKNATMKINRMLLRKYLLWFLNQQKSVVIVLCTV